MQSPIPADETAAAATLRALKAGGCDWLLANAGTDFPSIIEALAAAPDSTAYPTPMVIHHENVAVGMAHGAYLASGKMAAVMVHVNVGLANCAMGALNAAACEIPVTLLSGRTPVTESGHHGSRTVIIHWGQEMFDQASLVREAVKWDYELRYPEQAGPAAARALAAAQSARKGPVYLSLPREVLAGAAPADTPVAPPAAPAAPDPASIARAADLIAAARNPIIVTQLNAPAGSHDAVADLAERYAIPVVEFWPSVNAMPTTHPMQAGFDPANIAAEADLIVAIGVRVPFIPTMSGAVTAKLIALGPDPLDLKTPYRGFPAELSIACDGALGISALAEAMAGREAEMNLADRRAAQSARREARETAMDALVAAGSAGPMTPAYVSRVISDAMNENAALFSELAALPGAMRLNRPGQLFWNPIAGGLGWGLPAALGAKLAQPERDVIATVGDGSYLFANPAACHQVAATHGLPILTIVFNNGVWNAVRRATTGMYPDGAAVRANEMPLAGLGPSPDYAMMARAHGAHAEKVESPDALRPALDRALAETRGGRQALLDVRVI